jgi:hypothetical protein
MEGKSSNGLGSRFSVPAMDTAFSRQTLTESIILSFLTGYVNNMKNTNLPRAHYIWGTMIDTRGRSMDCFSYFSPILFYDWNFTQVIHPNLGPTILYWAGNPNFPSNRRANKYLRPVYEATYVQFPKKGARGDALIRHGAGERYYIPISGDIDFCEIEEWAEQSLSEGSYYIDLESNEEWRLILSDDEDDHFRAKMRFG